MNIDAQNTEERGVVAGGAYLSTAKKSKERTDD